MLENVNGKVPCYVSLVFYLEDDGVLREVWFGLGLSPLLTLLTNNPRFPTSPDEYIVLDKFEAPPNAGDGYGQRLSTYYKVISFIVPYRRWAFLIQVSHFTVRFYDKLF